MARKLNRRDFLAKTSTIGVGYWVASRTGIALAKSANEKVNVAAIGCGGMGGGDIGSLAGKGCNVVALCDVDHKHAGGSFQKFPNARRFWDFREMLDKMEKEIDAVNVSTPDHTHAVATMDAMKRGIHVYTQKPLTHDVYEARMLTKAARKYKVVTQMGNQGTAHDGLREAVEVIRAGAIGKPLEVHVWTNRPVWPQGIDRPKEGQPVRDGLNWDLWLGTAPERPYHEAYCPFKWRGWVDYGTGALGDMACHTANMAFMACDLGYPTSVECRAMSNFNGETYPTWSVIEYEFPKRGELPPLRWTWYDGGNDKPKWVVERLKKLAYGRDIPGSGSLIIGEKGTLFSPNDYGSSYQLLPSKDFEGYEKPEPSLPRAGGDNYGEWVNAIRLGDPSKTMSNFDYAGPLTETVVLGCVALRAGQRIQWDGPNMKITNVRKANDLLRREYRKGWTL
jgi:predicted dehydrogenase